MQPGVQPAGPSSRRFRSIERKVLTPLAAVFAVVATVVALSVAVVLSDLRDRTRASESLRADEAQSLVRTITDGGVDATSALRSALSKPRARDRVELALVVGGTPPRVLSGSRPEWEGQLLSQLPDPDAVKALSRVLASRIELAGTTGHLQLNGQQAVAPVGADGAALVRVVADDRTIEVLATTLRILALTVAGFIVLAFTTISLLRRRVTGPLTRIASDERLLGARSADRDARGPDDEITALADAIDAARAREAVSFAEIERLALVARKTTNAVLISDTEGRVVWVNEGFRRLSGYTLKEFLEAGPGHILQGIDAPKEAAARMHASLASGEGCRAELLHHAKDGRAYWVDIEIQPMRDAAGGLSGYMAIESDVTAAVRTREAVIESERRQKLAVEGAELGTWDWNLATGEIVTNERWCMMLGHGQQVVAPEIHLWRSAIHPDDRARVLGLLEQHLAGDSDFMRCEYRLRRVDGGMIWVHEAGRVYERDAEGKPLRMAGIHLDITERRRAEARFELAVKGSSAGIWDWDVRTNKNFMSARFKEMLGFPADYPMDSYDGWADLLHPEDRGWVLDALWAHVRTGSPYSLDYRLKHRSGEWRWYHAHGQAEWDIDGNPVRMAGSLEDIHERRVAEQARARLAAIVDGSEDAILGVSLDGRIESVNAAAARMFGVDPDALIGQMELDCVPESHRAHESHALERVSRGVRVEQYESRRRQSGGATVEVSVSVSPVLDAKGRVVAASKIVRDISLRREKRELEELNALLARQNHKLELMTERAHRFVDDVSHEFRTPLTVIKEYTSIIADGLGGPVSEKQAGWLQVIDVAAVDLNQMVEDFLDSSKLRAGRLRVDRRPCTAEGILDGVRGLISRKASSRSIQVRQVVEPGLPPVFADAEKVRRIVMNLVTNAIKFSPDGGVVTLSAKCLENGDVEFGVSDQGPGLAPADMRQIFERFRQLPNALAPSVKGFGLGLNIARQLVWLNLGTIRVESEQGKGATFSFTLPAVRMDAVIDRFFDRLAEREEAPESVAMLRLWPDEVEGRESLAELRRLAVASTRPSDIVVEDRDGSSIVLFGPTSSPATWQAHILEGLVRRNKHGGDGPRVELVGVWSYPDTTGEGREAIRAVVLKEATHAA